MQTIAPGKTRVGWIGTGVMGGSMAGHVLAAGYELMVFNRTRAKAQPLLDRGDRWAETPRQLAEWVDVVFTIVGYPADLRQVVLGDEGIVHGIRSGSTFVDMTTSEPALAREIEAAQVHAAWPRSMRRFQAGTSARATRHCRS